MNKNYKSKWRTRNKVRNVMQLCKWYLKAHPTKDTPIQEIKTVEILVRQMQQTQNQLKARVLKSLPLL
jgi:hypothetical protein